MTFGCIKVLEGPAVALPRINAVVIEVTNEPLFKRHAH